MTEEEMEENLEKDMTPILLKDLGMRYTSDTKKYKRRYGLYQCQYCGKEFEAHVQNVQARHTKSCGCVSNILSGNPSITHGATKHPLYQTWYNMKARCHNPKHKNYEDYGIRGVIICDRWLDVRNFIEDMYPSWEEGLTLDRIDVNGNYCPENCRWATQYIQTQNIRDIKSNNKSGFRGVSLHTGTGKWQCNIGVNNQQIYLGLYHSVLEAGKAYERYVRINNLEHNFTPALTEEEIQELYQQKDENE